MKTTITPAANAARPLACCLQDEPRAKSAPAWYAASTGNHQGLVIEEGTGRSVAVAYDKADAHLLASAPELLAALSGLMENANLCFDDLKELGAISRPNAMDYRKFRELARAALAKANGGTP